MRKVKEASKREIIKATDAFLCSLTNRKVKLNRATLKRISEPFFVDLFNFMRENKISVIQMASHLCVKRMEIYRWRKRQNYLKSLKKAQQLAVRLLALKASVYEVDMRINKLRKLIKPNQEVIVAVSKRGSEFLKDDHNLSSIRKDLKELNERQKAKNK